MKFSEQHGIPFESTGSIGRSYLRPEKELLEELAETAGLGGPVRDRIRRTAADLVRAVRRNSADEGGIDAFMQQYDLSSEEGVLLMCIAEALLRIPDSATADRLIADKLAPAQWQEHLGASDSLFVNASTWGLMLTGKMLKLDSDMRTNPSRFLGKLVNRAGEPIVRTAMRQAMRIIGHQFVMGRSIDEALGRAQNKANRVYRYSYDMLGEAALTAADAERYWEAYANAIQKIGAAAEGAGDIFGAPSISVKLSALHPRYEVSQHQRAMKELVPRVVELCTAARSVGIALTIDAEETERLELSLDVIGAVYGNPALADYEGFGLAVQAYQRRAMDVIRHLKDLSAGAGRTIPVRLVKGAYWDTEIKVAQEQGLASYPVFTRKSHTDVSYLACARLLLAPACRLYPQFATHNAHTLASILHFAGKESDFEFQRLHGMGEELYAEVIDPEKYGRHCRVYAPVGSHEDLLPYLVRRLLENGANTSFVNRIVDETVNVSEITEDPVILSEATGFEAHPRIPDPGCLFGESRQNSRGHNLDDRQVLGDLLRDMDTQLPAAIDAAPLVGGERVAGTARPSANPANREELVGSCSWAGRADVDAALARASRAWRGWDETPVDERAAILEKAADLYEAHSAELLALCVREAGKTLPDAVSELREAVDFLRYYASEARQSCATPQELTGPTGERNELGLRARGIFLCISPWNFPLAIFTGQVAAALAAGNAVLAKPAEQTSLVAFRATRLLLEAGVPADVLHFLPGDGAEVGGYAASRPEVAGVAFTGSTDTAAAINRTLANREGPLATLIAETGGLNAMFVDSSALPEQVVLDALMSAFNSAGQRCSALRLLCVQEDIAPRVIELLAGRMRELRIGDPANYATDIGPVIDEEARAMLSDHVNRLSADASISEIYRCPLSDSTSQGTFFPPTAFEIPDLGVLEKEVFGPVLHVLRFPGPKIGEVMDAVNQQGYGLTMGLHSRIDSRARAFVQRSGAGNIYINRNMIGAVVGVQPFGGRGLSGTGPKAGGPKYLDRFATEFTVSNNIAAVGGNASLLSLDD